MTTAPFVFDTGSATDTGRVRDHNEDRLLTRPAAGIWLVADGMGGHLAGEYASGAIAEGAAGIAEAESLDALRDRFLESLGAAHARIRRRAAEFRGATIGATLVALLARDDEFICIWSGDSRAYLMRDGKLEQITTDHTEVQELLRTGTITPAQAASWPRRNVITRAIGVFEEPSTEERRGKLRHGDTFLLCSDGLTEHVKPDELQTLLAPAPETQDLCDRLIALTLERGARDNVTVIVVRCMFPTDDDDEADTLILDLWKADPDDK